MVRRGSRDAEDDAVAVLDLERKRLAWCAVLDRDAERVAEERVEGINDGDSLDRSVLTVVTPWGIEKIPRSIRSPTSSNPPCPLTRSRDNCSFFGVGAGIGSKSSIRTPRVRPLVQEASARLHPSSPLYRKSRAHR